MWVRKTLLDDLSFSIIADSCAMEPLWCKSLLMMSILPYIFLLSGAAGASKNIGGLSPYLTPQYLVPLTLVAILIGVFNSFGGLTSIGISLSVKTLST